MFSIIALARTNPKSLNLSIKRMLFYDPYGYFILNRGSLVGHNWKIAYFPTVSSFMIKFNHYLVSPPASWVGSPINWILISSLGSALFIKAMLESIRFCLSIAKVLAFLWWDYLRVSSWSLSHMNFEIKSCLLTKSNSFLMMREWRGSTFSLVHWKRVRVESIGV